MGAVVSSLRSTLFSASAAVKALLELNEQFNALLRRAVLPPGFPVESPTESYWLDNPPFPELCDVKGPHKPEVDVVIIGSGIAGASIAKTLLELSHKEGGDALTVTVLEARQLCSGATARNGGHIKSTPYEMFAFYKKRLGPERARDIIRVQMRHLPTLVELGQQFPVGEAREVRTVDVFLEQKDLDTAKKQVEEAQKWMPEIEHKVWSGEEARKEFGVNKMIVGAVSYPAGALWPYRLVTSVWDDLLKRFPSLTIQTHTAAREVRHSTGRSPHEYDVETADGVIRARHVVHATNAFAPQLVPALRGYLTGALAHMSAQKPGAEFPPTAGDLSWSVVYAPGYDYVTQRPDNPDGSAGDLMVGGGFFRSREQGLDQIGRWDDSQVDALPGIHIRAVMPMVHEPRWGEGALLRKAWTGIVGITGDFLPLVGRLPAADGGGKGPSSGQWVAAGYNGEGMVWAWLAGTALALMVLGKENEKLEKAPGRPEGLMKDWFVPDDVKIDTARMRRAALHNLSDHA